MATGSGSQVPLKRKWREPDALQTDSEDSQKIVSKTTDRDDSSVMSFYSDLVSPGSSTSQIVSRRSNGALIIGAKIFLPMTCNTLTATVEESCNTESSHEKTTSEIRQLIEHSRKLDHMDDPNTFNLPVCILSTRVYHTLAFVQIRTKSGEFQEVLMSLEKLESIRKEDDALHAKRMEFHRSDSAYFETILKPAKVYSLKFLQNTTNFSSPSIVEEMIACLFHETEDTTRPILSRMPDELREMILSDFRQLQETIKMAPKMGSDRKIQDLKRIASFRHVTLARGVPLNPDLTPNGNFEAEILIFDEVNLKENVLYCLKNFTCDILRNDYPKKAKLTSTPYYALTPLKSFNEENKQFGRVTDTIESMERYKDAGIPIHGEIDIIAILESVLVVDQTSSSKEYVIKIRSLVGNKFKKVRVMGNPQEFGLKLDTSFSGSKVCLKNLKIIPTKLALVTTQCTEIFYLRDEDEQIQALRGD